MMIVKKRVNVKQRKRGPESGAERTQMEWWPKQKTPGREPADTAGRDPGLNLAEAALVHSNRAQMQLRHCLLS